MATTAPAPTATLRSAPAGEACCPGCGRDRDLPPTAMKQTQAELLVAQARIQELEAQVRQLNQKAAAAVDRWAEYEAELSKLRGAQAAASATSVTTATTPSQQQLDPNAARQCPSPTRASFLQSAPSRLSALLYPRKSTPNMRAETFPRAMPAPRAPGAGGATEDLLEALTREKTLRREAEGRLSATSREVEELSASLFEQANEMVADERRARARLEERVGELERRDVEKRRRLERLEVAMGRIERVRNLLAEK
ncbi:hypothetical protein TOPH_01689 [Tolypocladium ophioglossoides CBS 100239]|uniref:GDP/GTP exchange factor Sec2 N-terminal domain-containing protein n=1 Tax=Tolypocladium ophioglossoides (strain CBS 100239) TaxID=1163406 RepID=A0A0L0NHH5_TOLOC|nr:hypothetical protein TOPH_01689 [Tolypocladium ophioglossoides CBS 100239]